jgi:hypothetical protein
MSHATCTPRNRVNSRFLVGGSRIVSLTPDLSFDHNLCFKCPNGSCEPILNIYIPRAFHWHKKLYEPMGFDPWNRALKIWESIWDSNSHNGSSLGSVKVHSSHSLHSREHVMRLPSLPLGPQPCKPLPWSQA